MCCRRNAAGVNLAWMRPPRRVSTQIRNSIETPNLSGARPEPLGTGPTRSMTAPTFDTVPRIDVDRDAILVIRFCFHFYHGKDDVFKLIDLVECELVKSRT